MKDKTKLYYVLRTAYGVAYNTAKRAGMDDPETFAWERVAWSVKEMIDEKAGTGQVSS